MSTHIWVERSRSGGSIDILVEYLWCRLLCRIRKFAVAHAVKTRFLSPWKSILYCKFQSGNYRNSVEVLRIQRILRWYQWRWSVMFFDLQSYSISKFFRSAFKITFTVSFPNMRKKSSSQIPRRKSSCGMCCAFRGSPPELCPISVHVRYGIRMLSVSAFHRCAGRYGTAHWYVRGTEAKMTRRKKIEFKDLRTHTIKGYRS